MMMRNRIYLGLCAATCALLPAGLAAQGVFNMGMLTNTLTQGGSESSSVSSIRSNGGFRQMLRPAPRGPIRLNPAALNFRPDPAARKRNMAQFVASIRRVDPAGAKGLQDVLARHDLIAEMNAQLPHSGLRANSV